MYRVSEHQNTLCQGVIAKFHFAPLFATNFGNKTRILLAFSWFPPNFCLLYSSI
jgi:hypothetical protein